MGSPLWHPQGAFGSWVLGHWYSKGWQSITTGPHRPWRTASAIYKGQWRAPAAERRLVAIVDLCNPSFAVHPVVPVIKRSYAAISFSSRKNAIRCNLGVLAKLALTRLIVLTRALFREKFTTKLNKHSPKQHLSLKAYRLPVTCLRCT